MRPAPVIQAEKNPGMAERCLSCRRPLPPDAVVCVSCGYDLRTRTRIIRKESKEFDPPTKSTPRGWRSQFACAMYFLAASSAFLWFAWGNRSLTIAYTACVGAAGTVLFFIQLFRANQFTCDSTRTGDIEQDVEDVADALGDMLGQHRSTENRESSAFRLMFDERTTGYPQALLLATILAAFGGILLWCVVQS